MKVKIAGVKEADMVNQSRIFCREIEKILDEKFAEVKDSCEIVFYDGRLYRVSRMLSLILIRDSSDSNPAFIMI